MTSDERQAFEIEYQEALKRRDAAIRAKDEAEAKLVEFIREVDIFERIRRRMKLAPSASGGPKDQKPKGDKSAPTQVVFEFIIRHPDGSTAEDAISYAIQRMKSEAIDKRTVVRSTLYQLKKKGHIRLENGRYYA